MFLRKFQKVNLKRGCYCRRLPFCRQVHHFAAGQTKKAEGSFSSSVSVAAQTAFLACLSLISRLQPELQSGQNPYARMSIR
jgi:hypothetical protein